MASIAKHIQRLNKITSGPGAILLPSVAYLKLSLREAVNAKTKTGDTGATAFWRNTLPQVQFHNPQLPIAVTRYDHQENKPASLSIKMNDGSEQNIDVSKLSAGSILEELVKATNAEKVPESDIPVISEPAAHDL